MIAEIYEKEYDKYKDIDSIPIIVNVSKKQFNYLRYLGIYNKREEINLKIGIIQVNNVKEIKLEGDIDENLQI